MKKLLPITWLVVLLSVLQFGCKKSLEEKYAQNPLRPTSTKELKVASNFNWATVSDFTVTINPSHSGLLLIQSPQAEVYHKAFLLSGKPYSIRLNVPKTANKIVLYFNGSREDMQLSSATSYTSNLK